MPKYVLMDQRAIWTSPFHTSKKNVKYWVIWGGVVGGLIAADKHIENAARRHFPSDVVAGGVMGWFVGDYVYGKRHNTDLDGKSSFAQKILGHVRIGGAYPTVPAY